MKRKKEDIPALKTLPSFSDEVTQNSYNTQYVNYLVRPLCFVLIVISLFPSLSQFLYASSTEHNVRLSFFPLIFVLTVSSHTFRAFILNASILNACIFECISF